MKFKAIYEIQTFKTKFYVDYALWEDTVKSPVLGTKQKLSTCGASTPWTLKLTGKVQLEERNPWRQTY